MLPKPLGTLKQKDTQITHKTFFKFVSQDRYARVIVGSYDFDLMPALGFYTTLQNAMDAFNGSKKEEKKDGDLGDGCRPGSVQWHINALKSINDKKAIKEYVFKITGVRMLVRDMETVKAGRNAALKLIRERA